MEFAKLLRNEGAMDKETLTEWFQSEDVEINDSYLELINNIMEKNGWSRERVLNEKIKRPKRRLWRIISCACDL